MRVKKGKEWVDEGPTPHHGIRGYTSGGVPVAKAKPVLTAAIPKSPSKKKRDSEQKKLRYEEKKRGGWSSKPIKRSPTVILRGTRFELRRRTAEDEKRSIDNSQRGLDREEETAWPSR